MTNYRFLKEKHTENETVYAVLESELERINLADCYDKHGQAWGHYNAQDYSLHNSASDAEKECIKAIREKFKIDNDFEITINENSKGFFVRTDAELSNSKIAEINEFIKKFEEELAYYYEEVLAYNYHDGRNWQSIIIEGDNFDECCTHEIIEDEELITELEEALESNSSNYEIVKL